jgi:hypothetical protein
LLCEYLNGYTGISKTVQHTGYTNISVTGEHIGYTDLYNCRTHLLYKYSLAAEHTGCIDISKRTKTLDIQVSL